MNDLISNHSLEATEIMDNQGDRAILKTFKNGQQMKLIYDYPNQQVYYISGTVFESQN